MKLQKHDELSWIVAAGVVGADIGTSIFYGTGILFPIVGYLAPFFVLFTCLMMWFFKKTYEEGLALSPYNGGAYSMMLRGVGRRLAVFAGGLTFISYLATAAVSALSGSFYLSSFFENLSSSDIVLISFIPIIFFAFFNIKGIKEPAKIVTVVAIMHFFLLIVIAIWGLFFLMFHWDEIFFSKFFTLPNEWSLNIFLYGLASGFLGITGFESAAQIVEELETPTLKTVSKLYKAVIILVSITAPAISFLCLALLTPDEVQHNINHLLSGLANKLGGGALLTIIVLDATLTLYAAVNTAFVGFIGLAKTMSKQGNLPAFFLTRIAHVFPALQGYPMIALPFAFIAMIMSALVAGEVESLAKVYEISFLGVMVSFALGVIILRNRPMKRSTPRQYLSNMFLVIKNKKWPLIPFISGIFLAFASLMLLVNANSEVLLLLLFLLASTLLLMAYYRWGLLESRLEKQTDLRLGIGQFSTHQDFPDDLPHYIFCTGVFRGQWYINQVLRNILKHHKGPFELVIFYPEDTQHQDEFFSEQLQRIVSQQVAPFYNENFILSVKVLPGTLQEGLETLKKNYSFERIIIGPWTTTEEETLGDIIVEVQKTLETPTVGFNDFMKRF